MEHREFLKVSHWLFTRSTNGTIITSDESVITQTSWSIHKATRTITITHRGHKNECNITAFMDLN